MHGWIWPKFELIGDFIVFLLTCENEGDTIKNEGDRVSTLLIFICSRAGNSIVCGRICLKFKIIKAFMHVFVACKNEDYPIKNEGSRVFTTFLPLKVYGDFFQTLKGANSAVRRGIWPKL